MPQRAEHQASGMAHPLDPGRRIDPGPVWMGRHAERVLEFAFG